MKVSLLMDRLLGQTARILREHGAGQWVDRMVVPDQAADRGASAQARDVLDVEAVEVSDAEDIKVARESAPTAASARTAAAAPARAVPLTARTSRGNAPVQAPNRDPQAVWRPVGFSSHRVVHALGTRDYKLYVPATLATTSAPALVVMLHGCTQNPDDFAAGTRLNAAADAHGFVVLYPAQSRQANPQGCWNWFKAEDQERDRGEAGLLAALTAEVVATYGLDPQRVYVAGLSAGGAMAALLAAVYPERYAAVAVHSGLAPGIARGLPGALAAMKTGRGSAAIKPLKVPVLIIQGRQDATVDPHNAEQFKVEATESLNLSETVPGRRIWRDDAGQVRREVWLIDGLGHAWSGGSAQGSYTQPGADATAAMLAFFGLLRPLPA